MLSVTITIRGSKEMQHKLKKLGAGLYDMHRAMAMIGRELESYYENQAFRSQGGVFKQQWRPLSRAYQKQKLQKWGSRPLLVASGTMSRSFYHKSKRDSVTIGNTSKQFRYHQSSSTRYILPRRQMIGVNSRVANIIKDAVREDVTRKIRAL